MASAFVGERRVNDSGIQVVGAGGFRFPMYGDAGRRSGACGGAGCGRSAGRPVGLGCGLRDGGGGAGAGAGRVRLGLLGGADVRSLRGVCGRSGRGQHGGGVGRSGCVGVCGAGGGAVRVPFTGWRVWLHRAGVGLQRFGCRGASEPGPCGSASDPAGSGGRGVQSGWCGRSVRSPDAGGDTAVAIVAWCAVDGVPGRPVGGSATDGRRGWPGSVGDCAVCYGAGSGGAAAIGGGFAG